MKIGDIKNPVSSISGVGPQLTKTLAKINIFTAGDLLQYYPYDYDDRTQKITLNKYNQVKKVHTVARVVAHEWFGYGKMKTLKIFAILTLSMLTATLQAQEKEKPLSPNRK